MDLMQRKQANELDTNPVVFAPAGSGKTTELIKRVLKCLTVCEQPEQVLAITFTNKATAEMRNRVMAELKKGQHGAPVNSEHEKTTRDLALTVLARDAKKGWDLLKNPNRLEIKTIDSLCAAIVRQNPLSSMLGGNMGVNQKPDEMYEAAASDFLLDYNKELAWSENVKAILKHCNNSFERARGLLVEMLKRRDQWLPIVLEANHIDDAREVLTENARLLVDKLARPFLEAIAPYQSELVSYAQYAAHNLPDSPLKTTLGSLDTLPQYIESQADLDVLHQIGAWLLSGFSATGSNPPAVRKTMNAAQGFPAVGNIKDKTEKENAKRQKDGIKDLLTTLAENIDAVDIKALPLLTTYDYQEKEWQLMRQLLSALPILASKLHLIFRRKGEVDFIEIASAANVALGDAQSPGEALLKLDNRYRHILVDEFQDTSVLQFNMLMKITSGWQHGDGRTLFVVGDPMQSIYLFRGANISMFLRLADQGMNALDMTVLKLQSNFRSESQIVEWVNTVFAESFADAVDINVGATTYSPSKAAKPAGEQSAVQFSFYEASDKGAMEASTINEQIRHINATDPGASIAILGRARADLAQIITQLKHGDVGHRAIKIHKLADHPVIMDLTALTRALVHLADKTAWMALLRSPLVGLSSAELLTVAEGGQNNPRQVVLETLSNKPWRKANFTPVANAAITPFLTVMLQSLEQLERKRLTDIVKGAFYMLGGMSTLQSKADQKNIDTFFDALSKFSYREFDLARFQASIEELYAQDMPSDEAVQLMTIHQAKGLEFDYVFVPGCHKSMKGDEKRLLEYDVLYDNAFTMKPLAAPSPESGVKKSTMYSIIRVYQSLKRQHEAVRLAYVAMTRAVKKIYLSGEAVSVKGPEQFTRGSIFGIVKAGLPETLTVRGGIAIATDSGDITPKRRMLIKRATPVLPEGNMLAEYRGMMHVNNDVLPALSWHRDLVRIVGIVVHKTMERLAQQGPETFFCVPLEQNREYWRIQLLQNGLNANMVPQGVELVEKHLAHIRDEVALQWYFQLRSSLEVESAYLVNLYGKWKKQVIDLTFVEGNTRYVLDIKTAEPEDYETEAAFERRMLELHQAKMDIYEKCFEKENRTVRKGLLLTAIGKVAFYNLTDMVVGA